MGIIINGQNDTIGPVDNSMSLLGTVSIGGTMTIEDFTNIDSVGLGTFRNGLHVTDGNVAIGHNNPASNLHIKTTSSAVSQRIESTGNNASIFLLSNNDSNANTAIWFGESGGNESRGYVQYYRQDNYLRFGTNSSERLRILSTGTVNIGDQGLGDEYLSSTVKIRKDQNSVTRLSLRNENTGSGSASAIQVGAHGNSWMLQCGSAANDSNAFTIRVDGSANSNTGTERLRITTAGQMGLGTNDPNSYGGSVKLAVANTSGTCGLSIVSATNGDGNLYYADGTSGDATYRGYIRYNHTLDQFRIGVAGAERLRITSDGKVGVNDTSPASLFTVNNGTNDDHCVLIKNDNVGAYFGTYGTGHGSYPREVTINGTRIDGGSAPFLRIAGQGGIKFCVDLNSERLRIASNGNIGINESSPGAKLHIVDTMQATANGHNQILILGDDSGTDGESASIYMSAINATNRGCKILSERQSSSNDHDLIFQTSPAGAIPAERVRITSDGKMGVGTQNPDVLLHLSETNADPYNTVITHLKLNNSGGNGGSGSRIELKTGAARCWIQSFIDGGNSGSGGALVFGTPSSGTLGTERLRITSNGNVNIGGNYTQNNYRLQVDGGITGDYFVGRSLSDRTGYKWGASGIYYLTLGGSRSGNGASFTMFELTGMNNSKFVEIQISFAHAGGGSHGSYRRFVFTSNAYQGLNTLENATSNYGGGAGFTINKPSSGIVRVVWNGCSGFADGYTLCCQVKTSNSGTVFQNVDSAFG